MQSCMLKALALSIKGLDLLEMWSPHPIHLQHSYRTSRYLSPKWNCSILQPKKSSKITSHSQYKTAHMKILLLVLLAKTDRTWMGESDCNEFWVVMNTRKDSLWEPVHLPWKCNLLSEVEVFTLFLFYLIYSFCPVWFVLLLLSLLVYLVLVKTK